MFLSDSSVSCCKESQIKESRDICLAKVIDSLIPLRTVKWGERVFSLIQHPSEWSLALFIQVIPQLPSPVSNSQHMQCLQGWSCPSTWAYSLGSLTHRCQFSSDPFFTFLLFSPLSFVVPHSLFKSYSGRLDHPTPELRPHPCFKQWLPR